MQPESKYTTIKCPKCDSEYVSRVHRRSFMKLFTSKRKFICSDCGKRFFVEGRRARLDLTLIQ